MSKPLCTIVGMGPGISYALAEKFGSEGCVIAMISRDETKLQRHEESLSNRGIECHRFIGDAADFHSLGRAFDRIKSELGETDILVYNVSVFRESLPTELDPELCVKDFRANVAGALVAVQQVVHPMKEKRRGKILITGGGQGIDPYPPFSSLAIGKAGIRNLSMSLAGELEPFGIHVATVTVCGMVAPDTPYAPQIVAEAFWELYNQDGDGFQREIVIE